MIQLFFVSQWWFKMKGTLPSISLTILVIVDIQVPLLVLVVDTQDDEYLSLVEAEGLQNSVAIVLEDISKLIISFKQSLTKDTPNIG